MEKHGHRLVADLDHEMAAKLIERIGAKRPAMANLTRAILNGLMGFAIKRKWRTDNPFTGMESYKIGNHHAWTDQELKQFEKQWPIGTRERLAFELLLQTGQRGGDVVAMRRSDLVEGAIRVKQQKTGAELTIGITPALDRAMKAFPARGLTLIGDASGRPMTRPGLTALVKRAAKAAGLPTRCLPHRDSERRGCERSPSTARPRRRLPQ